jgi:hypothetical protein
MASIASRIPALAIERAQLMRLHLDHHAGFLLSLVDGRTTVETLLDLSGMQTDETLRLLDELIGQGVVTLT